MIFEPTSIHGAFIIKGTPHEDARGSFTRTFCLSEFSENGLNTQFPQHGISRNHKKGTLRGLHFQTKPYQEVKLVRCIQGKIFDVIVDIRQDSSTFGQWYSAELSEENQFSLYIPKGIAHGFITLEENTHVHYLISEAYSPDHAKCLNWCDKDLNISWPISPTSISERDNNGLNLSMINSSLDQDL